METGTSERAGRGSLLERGDEIAAAERAIQGAAEGSGTLLLIEGAAGIGKSRLLADHSERAERSSMAVLRATGARLEADFSFGVVLQLLGERVYRELAEADRSAEPADGSLFRGAASMARPLFEGGDQPPGRLAGDAAFSLLHGLYWLVANVTEESPVLVCVDDAQWADLPSLGFLNFLAQRIDELPLVLALTVRTGEPTEADEQVAELRDRAGGVLHPAPLSAAATASYVRGVLPDAEDEFCEACARMTRGNPLYLRELLAAVRNDGVRPGADGADTVASLSPESISRAVLARIARLPDASGALAEAVAVLGAGTTLELASKLAELDHAQAVEAADMLAAAEILTPEEPKSFVHPIVAGAVYGGIPFSRRAAAHLRAAGLLERAGSAPESIASHLLRAEHGGGDWVSRSLRDAAERARGKGGQAAALRYLGRALEEDLPGNVRGELLALRGLVEAEAGETKGSETLGEAVELISDPVSRARALFDLAIIQTHGGRYVEGTAAADRGLRELGDDESQLAAELEALRHMCGTWVDVTDAEATRERLDRATAEPDLEASSAGRAVLANSSMGLLFAGGDVATVCGLAERALSRAQPGDDPFDRVVFPLAGLALAFSGESERAEQATTTAVDAALASGSILDLGAATQVRAIARHEAGRIADALVDAESAVEAGRWGWGATLPMAHAQLALDALERGELEAAEAALPLPGGDERWMVNVSFGTLMLARAKVLHAAGRRDDAFDLLVMTGRYAEAGNAISPVLCPWRPAAVEILVERGESERALELARAELEEARRFGASAPIGTALRALGLATGGARGAEVLAESVDVLRESQARTRLARSIVALGAELRRAGQNRKAKEVLREGLDLAHRCGATVLADTAAEELRVAGGRPRRRALRGVEALTASELRTAKLAAQGLTNREIAERLFVTRRTVEMHLSSAYGKLEIESREGLEDALRGDREPE